MNYVIGKNSRLGLALKNEIEDITLIPSNIFLDAIKNKSLLELFKNANSKMNCIFIGYIIRALPFKINVVIFNAALLKDTSKINKPYSSINTKLIQV
jgi:hypothetical protein